MPSNAELTPLERNILRIVKNHGPIERDHLQLWHYQLPMAEIDQAISNLIAKSYIIGSHDTPIRYEISRLEERL